MRADDRGGGGAPRGRREPPKKRAPQAPPAVAAPHRSGSGIGAAVGRQSSPITRPLGRVDAPIVRAQHRAQARTKRAQKAVRSRGVAPAIPKLANPTPRQRSAAVQLTRRSLRSQGLTVQTAQNLPPVQRQRVNRALGYQRTPQRNIEIRVGQQHLIDAGVKHPLPAGFKHGSVNGKPTVLRVTKNPYTGQTEWLPADVVHGPGTAAKALEAGARAARAATRAGDRRVQQTVRDEVERIATKLHGRPAAQRAAMRRLVERYTPAQEPASRTPRRDMARLGREVAAAQRAEAKPYEGQHLQAMGLDLDFTELGRNYRGLVKGVTEGGYDNLFGKAAADALGFPVGAVQAGAAISHAASEALGPLGMLIPGTGLLTGAGMALDGKLKMGGNFKPALELADAFTRGPLGELLVHQDPAAALKSFKEHPLYGAADFAMGYGALGRLAGGAGRLGMAGARLAGAETSRFGRVAAALGDTTRADAALFPGSPQGVSRSYSKNALTKARQKAQERGMVRRGEDPNVIPAKSTILHDRLSGRTKALRQEVHEFASTQGEGVRRQGQSQVADELVGLIGKSAAGRVTKAVGKAGRGMAAAVLRRHRDGDAGPVVEEAFRLDGKKLDRTARDVLAAMVERRVLGTDRHGQPLSPARFKEELTRELTRLEEAAVTGRREWSREEVRLNRLQRRALKKAIDDPKLLENAGRMSKVADRIVDMSTTIEEGLIKMGVLDRRQALISKIRPLAVARFGHEPMTAGDRSRLEKDRETRINAYVDMHGRHAEATAADARARKVETMLNLYRLQHAGSGATKAERAAARKKFQQHRDELGFSQATVRTLAEKHTPEASAAARAEAEAAAGRLAEHESTLPPAELAHAKRVAAHSRATARVTEAEAELRRAETAATRASGAESVRRGQAQARERRPGTPREEPVSVTVDAARHKRVLGELDAIASEQLEGPLRAVRAGEPLTAAQIAETLDVLRGELDDGGLLTAAMRREAGDHPSTAAAVERGAKALRAELEAARPAPRRGRRAEPLKDPTRGQARVLRAKAELHDAREAAKETAKALEGSGLPDYSMGLRDKFGQPVTTDEVLARMDREGIPMPGYIRQARGREASSFFRNWFRPSRRAKVSAQRRTGAATARGGYASDWHALAESLLRRRGDLDSIQTWDRFVHEFGLVKESGQMFTPKDVEPWLREHGFIDFEGNLVDGMPELTAVWAYPKDAPRPIVEAQQRVRKVHESVLGRNAGRAEDAVAMDELGPAVDLRRGGELEELLDGPADPNRRIVLMPAEQLRAFVEHQQTQTTTAGKVGNVISNTFRQTVLPFSTKWLTGNVAEAFLRLAIAGVRPTDLWRGHKILQTLKKLDEEQYELLRTRSLGGLFYGSAERLKIHSGASRFEHTSLEGIARTLEQLGTPRGVIASMGEAQMLAHLAAVAPRAMFSGLTQLGHGVFRLNKFFETQSQIAALGKYGRIRGQEFSGSWFKALTMQRTALEQVVQGLTGTREQIRFARYVDETLGKYARFSPQTRRIIQTIAPFLPWYLNSLRFVIHTLPAKHPVLTGLLANTERAMQPDMETLRGEVPPGDLEAALPTDRDHAYLVLSRYTPFGAFTSGLDVVTDPILPQIMTSFGILKYGVNFTGRELDIGDSEHKGRNIPGGKRALMALSSQLEALLPFAQIVRRLQEHGETAYDDSYLWAPHTKEGTATGGPLGTNDLGDALNRIFNPFRPVVLRPKDGGSAGSNAALEALPAPEREAMEREARAIAASSQSTAADAEQRAIEDEARRILAAQGAG